ncbi:hypothetical protein [Salisaeta longa]|uniref:hypothetical protein n=1 Tax=Salisaeta longa TaxID=503170 RepID=UPI0003B63190|nr:hypothetical protein [Salisaeta longa]
MPNSNETPRAAYVLKGGAVVFVLMGLVIGGWLARQAWAHPEIQASQFGYEAPLWIPALVFVVGATGAGSALLWHASTRVANGEDLFAQRHRRRASDRPADDK